MLPRRGARTRGAYFQNIASRATHPTTAMSSHPPSGDSGGQPQQQQQKASDTGAKLNEYIESLLESSAAQSLQRHAENATAKVREVLNSTRDEDRPVVEALRRERVEERVRRVREAFDFRKERVMQQGASWTEALRRHVELAANSVADLVHGVNDGLRNARERHAGEEAVNRVEAALPSIEQLKQKLPLMGGESEREGEREGEGEGGSGSSDEKRSA